MSLNVVLFIVCILIIIHVMSAFGVQIFVAWIGRWRAVDFPNSPKALLQLDGVVNWESWLFVISWTRWRKFAPWCQMSKSKLAYAMDLTVHSDILTWVCVCFTSIPLAKTAYLSNFPKHISTRLHIDFQE